MPTWSPHLYLKYGAERTQPAIDLVARIQVESPARIIDLGCGTGNSTAALKARWPDARVTGLDSSPAMLAQARADLPEVCWTESTIEAWQPDERFDVIYANAAFQWLKNLEVTIPTLLEFVADDGVLAFQVPNNESAPYHRKLLEVAERPNWRDMMRDAKSPLTYKDASFYYELLSARTRRLDIWETNYIQVMDSHAAIVDWAAGTGLRPYLEALRSDDDRKGFKAEVLAEYERSYPRRGDGKVLFPFNRQFVVAYVG